MKKIALILIIVLFAATLRFWNLGNINQIYFDEVLYLYDAYKYQQGVLALEREAAWFPKHPMLGLAFMQLSITAFGFNYLGWRFFSAIFGVLSVLALFLLADRLFSFRAALLSAFFLTICFLHLVLSRIAMLDIYLLFFILAGFYFLAGNLERKSSTGLLLAGTFFGLALTTKWSALFSLLSAVLIYFILSKDPRRILKGTLLLFLLPIMIFLLASLFLNLSAGMDLVSWISFELRNLRYHQLYCFIHPAHAPPWGWPFLLRSTPFYGVSLGKNMTKAIIAFGNPAIYWVMVPALGYLIHTCYKGRNRSLLFILLGFFGAYLPWLAIDLLAKTPLLQERGMFFYYFLPSLPFYLMGLSFILDKWLENKTGRIVVSFYLALVVGLFIFFLPIILGLPISLSHFNKLIWFKGWF